MIISSVWFYDPGGITMRLKLNRRKGSALALVLIVMAVLMILGTSVLRIAVAENRFAQHNENKIQAYYAARSGAQAVAEYIIKDPNNNAEDLLNKTSALNTQLDKGDFIVEVKELDSNTIEILSTGEYRGVQQTAKIRLKKNSGGIFEHAIVGQNIIASDGNANKIIIYGTIATKENAPIIGNKAVIYDNEGNVISPPSEPDGTLVFPEIVEPASYDITYPTGLNLNGTGLTIDASTGEKNIKVNGNLLLKNATLKVKGGDVHLYIKGNITFDTNAKMTSENGGRLFIYVIDPSKAYTIYFKGSGEWNNLFIYAPNSTIDWQNAAPNGKVKGALIGNKVLLKNQYTFEYDENLAKGSALGSDSVGVWNSGYVWVD